jgi:hypothetical protein
MINNEELFRIINFPNLDGYLATLSKDEGEALTQAENVIMELKFTLDKRVNELNYRKLKREFSFTLQTSGNDKLHDFSTPEVAKLLGRTPATVRSYIKLGKLSAYQTFNGDFRISQKEIEVFLSSLRTTRRFN